VTAVPPQLASQLHDWPPTSREQSLRTRRTRGGIIFDLDDTLYPREHFVQSGLMAVARHLEERFDVAALTAFRLMSEVSRDGARGRELQAACATFHLPASLVPELVAVFRSHSPVLRLPRATAQVLRRLRGDGWRLVVLTNGLPQVQRRKVGALRLAALVDGVVYAEDHADGGKPAPAAFRVALRTLGVSPRRAVCVGDDLTCDIAGARALGLRTVRIKAPDPGAVVPSWYSADARPPAPPLEADTVIDSIDSLPAALARLTARGNCDAA
jgi:putative hydrolase of the HAD superfamily